DRLLARDQERGDLLSERQQLFHRSPRPSWQRTRKTPISVSANCFASRAPRTSASDCRSVSTIRQTLIFLSPPRSFSSIATGIPPRSRAVQISPPATEGS